MLRRLLLAVVAIFLAGSLAPVEVRAQSTTQLKRKPAASKVKPKATAKKRPKRPRRVSKPKRAPAKTIEKAEPRRPMP